ncbi:hypothetical protein RJ40_02375 [Methanofollis aquaemaris]|uniref:Uncharacterized protein n=1 Tax=Methanofollis aquaemaris TaxID=126734 RepID=A0A8A3S3C3_9EURY|nr:hypothetical protein [Methanofollis aquaemaris]QSZ66423.1 hypothetical protein RJ40_02375 [Methanofollis aquaemaris]
MGKKGLLRRLEKGKPLTEAERKELDDMIEMDEHYVHEDGSPDLKTMIQDAVIQRDVCYERFGDGSEGDQPGKGEKIASWNIFDKPVKCPQCGSEDVEGGTDGYSLIYDCFDCGHRWFEDDDDLLNF